MRWVVAVMGAAALSSAAASVVSAQVVRGRVLAQTGRAPVGGATVTATDSVNAVIAQGMSGEDGRFSLKFTVNRAFKVTVAKLGWLPSFSDLLKAGAADTLDIEFLVPQDPVALPEVEVKAAKSTPNARALEEARRRGWKTYSPQLVEEQRERSNNFVDLMRNVGVTGLNISDRDCIRSVRFNRCLTYVVDGMPAGTQILVPPGDVYFFSVLSATESAVVWGDKAPWGAVVIYTRMGGDSRRP